jgi:hypothetical protein
MAMPHTAQSPGASLMSLSPGQPQGGQAYPDLSLSATRGGAAKTAIPSIALRTIIVRTETLFRAIGIMFINILLANPAFFARFFSTFIIGPSKPKVKTLC